MQYRFFVGEETRTLYRETPEYELFSIPQGGRWPNNWEWKYDFPDIKEDLRRDLRRFFAFLALKILFWCGVKVKRGTPEYTYAPKYVEVDSRDVIQALVRKLDEKQKRNIADGYMIIVGPRELRELAGMAKMWGPLRFSAQMEYGYQGAMNYPPGARQTNYYIYDVPIVVLPDFVGVAVIPDFTGTASKRMTEHKVTDRYGFPLDGREWRW